MKLKRFGNLVTDEVSPLLSELLQSFAQETGQITYTDIYNYKGSTEKSKKLIYHINKWNYYVESGQDDKALKKSDEIRQMVKDQKEFSGDYTKIYLIFDKKSSNLLIDIAFDSIKDVQEYAKSEISELTEYKIKPIRLYHEWDKSFSGKREFSMKDLPEVTFKTSNPEQLTEIIKAIGELGNPGHAFTIVLDPGSESETKFTWDGDGSDYIELDGIKSFSEREQVPQYIADEVDASGVVVKYKGDWRIVSKKTTPYEFWDAKYKTKQDAEDALAAYHANK